jgi:hypothetical protein
LSEKGTDPGGSSSGFN